MQWIHRAAATLQVSVLASGIAMAQDNDYRLGPDSQFNPAVPHGKVTHFTLTAAEGSVFPGTVRDVWVYAPPGHDGSRPAALMVFQDGGGYVSTNGAWRVPWVFDNLIARGAMPPARAADAGRRAAAVQPEPGIRRPRRRLLPFPP